MKYILMLAVTFLFSNRSPAQISGRLLDLTRQPLAGASVFLHESPSQKRVTVVFTDSSGRYHITPETPGNYILKFSLLGMTGIETAEIRFEGSPLDMGESILTESSRMLEGIVIRKEAPVMEYSDAGISFNVSKSILSTGASALEVIERMPGVRLDRMNGRIYLNGKGGVLVLINERAVRLPASELLTYLGGLNSNEILKIEILNTPPAGYDADGAVIRIVLKKYMRTGGNITGTAGHGLKPRASTTLQYSQNFNRWRLSASYSYSLEKTYSDMTVQSRQNMPVFNGNMEVELWDTTNYANRSQQLSLNLDYPIDSMTTLSVSGGGNFSKNRFATGNHTTYFLAPDSVIYLNSYINNLNHWRGVNLASLFSKQINSKQKVSLDIDFWSFRNRLPSTILNNYGNLGEVKGNPVIFSTQQKGEADTRIGLISVKVDFTSKISPYFSYDLGVKYSRTGSISTSGLESILNDQWVKRAETQNDSDMKEAIRAGYLQLNYRFTPKIRTALGSRLESSRTTINNLLKNNTDVDNQVSRFFSNALFVYDITGKSGIQLSYSERISRPAYNDLASYAIYSDVTAVYTGNSFLKPTFSQNLKFSYSYKDQQWGLVYSRDKDLIIGGQLTEAPLRNLLLISPQNIGRMATAGLQANQTFKITSWWSTALFYQVFRQKMLITYTSSPLHHAYFTFSSTLTNQIKLTRKYTIEVSGWYNSKTYFGTIRFGSIGAVNLGLKKDLANNKGSFQFTLTDLFGTTIGRLQYGTLTKEAFSIRNDVRTQSETSKLPVFKFSYTRSIGGNKTKDSKASSEEVNRVRR